MGRLQGGVWPGLTSSQGYCPKLHHFNFIPLLKAVSQVKCRTTGEGEHIHPFCRQEFQILP